MGYKIWTDKEVVLLRELYPKIRVNALVDKFPGRTRATIVAKAFSLSLLSPKIWQENENNIIKNLFENEPKENLLKLLPGRSWSAILAQGERLGLRRKTNKPRLQINENYFDNWSSNSAYILGFVLADGCIVKGTYNGYSDMLKFGVNIRDLDILEKIKSELNSDHKISKIKSACYLSLSSQKLVNSLKKLGIDYRKSLREKIPRIPKLYVRDFIRGIIDGDGSLSINKNNYPSISVCGGKETMIFIQDRFLRKLKVFSKLTQQSYKDTGFNLFQIGYRGSSAQKIINYIYKNAELYLNRKYNLATKCLDRQIRYKRTNYILNKNI